MFAQGGLRLHGIALAAILAFGSCPQAEAETAVAQNDVVTVTATGDGVLAVRTNGPQDFDVIVAGEAATAVVMVEPNEGQTLIAPREVELPITLPKVGESDPVARDEFRYEVRYTLNPDEEPGQGKVRRIILKVDMLAHRPQTEGPGYGSPFLKHEIPEDEEESPGVGIRYNGDDDDGDTIVDRSDGNVSGENDLIEVILTADPPSPSGLEYVLKRSNSDLRVWDSSTKGTVLLGGSDEEVITFSSSTRTVWVERSGTSDSTDLEFFARPTGTTDELCKDTLHFYKFKSVVVFFEGEGRDPHDPPTTGNYIQDLKGVGISTMALNLYLDGYDVHNYVDSPSSVGFDEIKSAVTERDVDHVALIGYSHGGGTVYDVSVDLDADPTTFSLDFTAYIDAIAQPAANPLPETHRPVNTAFHVNYYQEIQLGETPLQGAASLPAGAGVEDNVDDPTATESHLTIDDETSIQAAVINYLKSKVDP